MNHAQFYDHAKADHNNNNNNVSSPLKINKASHLIKKSPSNSLPSSSSSSSLYNGLAATTSTTTPILPHHHQQQPRHPVIIYTHSPKIIHTHPRDFMALVQKLTGLSPQDDLPSPSHPPRTTSIPQQYPKSEPMNEELNDPQDLSCFGDIIRLDEQENNYHMTNNNMNKKCDLLANDENECTSVITDENNGSSYTADNSSASCYVPPPPTFDQPNINDNKDTSIDFNYYNYNNSSSIFDTNLTPFDPNLITTSSDYPFSDQQFCNYTDSLIYMPNMRNSFSSSSSESIKELPDF